MKTLIQTLFFFLLVTQICFAQWMQLGLEDKGIKEITARNSNIFAVTTDSSLYRSTDNGISWLQIVDSCAVDVAIAPTGSLFLIAESGQWVWENSIYRSSDNGNSWVNLNIIGQLPPPPEWAAPSKVTVSPVGFVFCGLFAGISMSATFTALALSTDDGLTWTTPGWEVYSGDLFDFRGQSVITYGSMYHIYPIGHVHNTYLSSDNGQTWSLLCSPLISYSKVLGMCLNGNILLGGFSQTSSGLFISSDSCNTWTQVSSLIPETGLSIESGGMLVGTDTLGVFLFSDNGDILGSFNEGLTNLNTHTLTMDNNDYVYLGTDNGVWRRPLSEITSVEEHSTAFSSSYILLQNFPNPFNPSTKIKYSIPQSSNVVIKVFDILGNEIETLINEEKQTGPYEITWYAENLPSGIYFYQLKAGDFIQTKKMLLLK